ncbi:MAG TPA: LpxD N-terminal domain-containing protein, partial [Burkholderiaceae bacterium]|nr:LpxD N-terminal domain-containing protein [Burkholderiaceae bacterium]
MGRAAPAGGKTLADLAAAVAEAANGRLPAQILGDSSRHIRAVAPLDGADAYSLSFLANPRYRSAVLASRAGAIVMSAEAQAALQMSGDAGPSLVICAQPYAWFAFAAQALEAQESWAPGVDATARVAADAVIGAGVRVEAHAVIEAGAQIGDRCRIGAGCYVGRKVVLGAATRLYPGVRVMDGCSIGVRGIFHSGAVIGADGFGFAPFDGRWIKIPQTGK